MKCKILAQVSKLGNDWNVIKYKKENEIENANKYIDAD